MAPYERKYVSKLVPSNLLLLTSLLVGVAVVNSAVRLSDPLYQLQTLP